MAITHTDSDGPKPILKAHVIDPDPNAAKMLDLVLRSLGLEVTIQKIGHDITATLEKILPDFMITELIIPETDIFKVFEDIYRDRRFARTKVLICSNKVESVGKKHLFRKYNLDRVYRKPLNADKFKRDISHLMGVRFKQLGFKSEGQL